MPYIFIGLYIKRFGVFDKLFSYVHLFDIAVMLAILAFVIRHYFHHGTALYLMAPCMVYVIVTLFYRYRDVVSPIKKVFQWWGKNSLEIYSLHYFLLHTCCFPFVYQATMSNNAETIELVAASVFAFFICCICVYVGNLIKNSEWLGYLCFGNKK